MQITALRAVESVNLWIAGVENLRSDSLQAVVGSRCCGPQGRIRIDVGEFLMALSMQDSFLHRGV